MNGLLAAVLATASAADVALELGRPFQQFSASALALTLVALACGSLGVLVVVRRVVFVGLTLAEVSACGVGVAFFTLGLLPAGALFEWWHDWGPPACAGLLSLGFVALVSAERPSARVSREALIGVVHALAAGVALLLVWRSTEGLEELKHILGGDVLFVHTRHLVALGATTGVVLACLWRYRRPLVLAGLDPDVSASLGFRPERWQALFFLGLGATIAVTTWVGGVMLSFALLIVPAFAALLVEDRLGRAVTLATGCALGAIAVGLTAAFRFDYPTPPAVTAALIVPLGAAVLSRLTGWRWFAWSVAAPGFALALVGVGLAVCDLAGRPLLPPPGAAHSPLPTGHRHDRPDRLGHPAHHDAARLLEPSARAQVIRELARKKGDPASLEVLVGLLDDREPSVRASALEALVHRGEAAGADAIAARLAGFTEDLRLEAARALAALGDARAGPALCDLLAEPAPVFLREQAAEQLDLLLGFASGYDALAPSSAPANREAIARARAALAARRKP